MARSTGFVGLFTDGSGKKIRVTFINDETGEQVAVQGASVSDPDTTALANVKVGGTLPNAALNGDCALVVTPRDLPPNAAQETGGVLANLLARISETITVSTISQNPAGILNNQVVAPTVPTPLGSGTMVNGVVVKALVGNSGTIYIGGPGLSSGNGFPLEAGATASMGIPNLSDLLILGNGVDKLAYLGS